MKRSLLALGLGLALAATAQAADIRLVIHGGAGTMAREDFTPERAAKYHEGLQQALQAGYAVLEQGGTAVDAVKAAINQMELNPNFNAGRGAVFTSEGKNELDSSIMDGKTLSAGAVAGVTNVKHPINCADLVRTKSPHVMMATKGAEEFCAKNGAETVDPKWFFTDFRYQQLQKAKEKEQIILDHDGDHPKTANAELFIDPMMYDYTKRPPRSSLTTSISVFSPKAKSSAKRFSTTASRSARPTSRRPCTSATARPRTDHRACRPLSAFLVMRAG